MKEFMHCLMIMCLATMPCLTTALDPVEKSDCTLLVVGRNTEENDMPALIMSDLDQLKDLEFPPFACFTVQLDLGKAIFNLSQILTAMNAIPKEKELIQIAASTRDQLVMDADAKCAGYAVELRIENEVMGLCSSSLENLHINVSYFCFSPRCIPDYGFEDGTAPFLLQLMVDHLGLVVDRVQLSRGYDIRVDEQGGFFGLVGDVAGGKAQVGMGEAALTWERIQHIDYTSVISTQSFGFCSKKPTRLSPLFAIVRPFSALLWALLTVLLLAIPLILHLQERVNYGRSEMSFVNVGLTLAIFWRTSAALGETSLRRRRILSWRMLATFWMLMGTLLSIAYCSQLLAEMVATELTEHFDTASQMLEADMRVFLLEGSVVVPAMELSLNPSMRQLYQKGVLDKNGIVKPDQWRNAEMTRLHEARRAVRVCTPTSALMTNSHISEERLESFLSSNIVAKGSSLREPLDRVTRRALAAGLLQRKFHDIVNEGAREFRREGDSGKTKNEWEPLTLHHFYGLFMVWMAGLACGSAIFACKEGMMKKAVLWAYQ